MAGTKGNRGGHGTKDGKPGSVSSFDPDKHIPILMSVFRKGQDIAAFCAHFTISRDTFRRWTNKHPEFEEAYAKARELARVWWEQQGQDNLDNPHFNQNVWRLMMRNRFDMTDTRIVRVPFKATHSPSEQFEILKTEIAKGNLTPEEAIKLANFIAAGTKIEESTQMRKDLDMLLEQAGFKQ
jgi:hypothetical protein